MKHLKPYNESIIPLSIQQDLRDICLELDDTKSNQTHSGWERRFIYDIVFRGDNDVINYAYDGFISIATENHTKFAIKDIEDVIERIKEYCQINKIEYEITTPGYGTHYYSEYGKEAKWHPEVNRVIFKLSWNEDKTHLKSFNESTNSGVSSKDVEEICYELTDLGYDFQIYNNTEKVILDPFPGNVLIAVLIDKKLKKSKYQEIEDTLLRLIDFLGKNLISISIKYDGVGVGTWDIFYQTEADKDESLKKYAQHVNNVMSYNLSDLEKVDKDSYIKIINIKFHGYNSLNT